MNETTIAVIEPDPTETTAASDSTVVQSHTLTHAAARTLVQSGANGACPPIGTILRIRISMLELIEKVASHVREQLLGQSA